MNPKGAFKLFNVAGITVWADWFWIVALVIRFINPSFAYEHSYWKLIEALSLFGIVLLHEFGHSFATRSVGGSSDEIVLSLFGGVSYCAPPRRPGAMLWAIAAGPLVNVALIPVFYLLRQHFGTDLYDASDPQRFLYYLGYINIILLIFNLLPIYPLDGGKILWSLLWFIVGEGRSLIVASVIGMVLSTLLAITAIFYMNANYLGFLAGFMAFEAYRGYRLGMSIRQNELDGYSYREPDPFRPDF